MNIMKKVLVLLAASAFLSACSMGGRGSGQYEEEGATGGTRGSSSGSGATMGTGGSSTSGSGSSSGGM
jgi:hypothetical protein